MAYVSTFIPTDQKALQGTLDEYQKAYDIQTAKTQATQEAGDAITNTRAYDMAEKNKVMKEFSDVQAQLDKQFNFDRSSTEYADALSRRIGELKSKPIWALMSKKDELEKQRNSLKTQLGTNYYEKFDPNSVTLEQLNQDQSIFDKWVPHNLNDFYTRGAAAGKGLAEDINAQKIGHVTPWLLEFTNSTGQASTQAARNYLMNDEEGQIRLKDAISSAGGDPNDPKLQATVMDAMVANMVGKETKSRVVDEQWQLENRPKTDKPAEDKNTFGLNRLNDIKGDKNPYPITHIDNFHESQANLDKIDTEIESYNKPIAEAKTQIEKDALIEKQNNAKAGKRALSLDLAKVNAVKNRIEYSTDLGVKANQAGVDLIKTNMPWLSDQDALDIHERMKDVYIDSNAWDRTNGGQTLDALLSKLSAIPGFLGTSLKFPGNSTPKQEVDRIMKLIKPDLSKREQKLMENNPSFELYNILEDALNKSASDPAADARTLLTSISNAMDLFSEYNNYYKGKGNYLNSPNYSQIEKEVDGKLKAGVLNTYQQSSPEILAKPALVEQVVTYMANNMDTFQPTKVNRKRKGLEWSNDLDNLQAEMKKPGTIIRFLTNPEDPLIMSLISKEGERVDFEIDENRAGFGTLLELNKIIKDTPEIMNQMFRTIKFEDGAKELVDDVKELTPFFQDANGEKKIDKISGMAVKKTFDAEGKIIYELYNTATDEKPVKVYGNLPALMSALMNEQNPPEKK